MVEVADIDPTFRLPNGAAYIAASSRGSESMTSMLRMQRAAGESYTRERASLVPRPTHFD